MKLFASIVLVLIALCSLAACSHILDLTQNTNVGTTPTPSPSPTPTPSPTPACFVSGHACTADAQCCAPSACVIPAAGGPGACL